MLYAVVEMPLEKGVQFLPIDEKFIANLLDGQRFGDVFKDILMNLFNQRKVFDLYEMFFQNLRDTKLKNVDSAMQMLRRNDGQFVVKRNQFRFV